MFRFSFKIILQNVYEEGVKSEIHWVFYVKTTGLQFQIPQNLRVSLLRRMRRLVDNSHYLGLGSWVGLEFLGVKGNDVEIT